MKQWIIERYNKGQDKYFAVNSVYDQLSYSEREKILEKRKVIDLNRASCALYDFLFNPKWEFSKAFWGEGEMITDQDTREKMYQIEDDKYRGLQNYICVNKPAYKYRLQEMAISLNPLKYLEQFKSPIITKGE